MSTLTTVLCGTLLGLTAVSCADQNFDWEDAKSQNPEYTFRKNFESLVGPIDPNQSWDFSTAGKKGTRAEVGSITVSEGKYEKTFTEAFRTAVAEVLPEPPARGTRDHYKKGKEYTLYAQEGGFDIYPIWHGKCMQWDLYVNDVKVGSYADIMKMMGNASTTYGEANKNEFKSKGWHIEAPVNTPIFIKLRITDSTVGDWFKPKDGDYAKIGDEISSILPKPYTVKRDREEKEITFGSLSLNFDELKAKGQTVSSDFLTKIIMFEDSNTSKSDTDFNDFILGIFGNVTEEEIHVEDDKIRIPLPVSKRYMVEDLGSTAKTDIDFNDLVVDLTSTQYGYCKKDAAGFPDMSTWEADPESTPVQTAQIRAMGGTLDFLFMLTREDGGVTKYKPIYKKSANVSDVKEMKNTYPDDIARGYENLIVGAPFTITGWDPATNNVAFYVSREEIDINVDGTEITTIDQDNTSASGNLYSSFATAPYKFPNPGDVPYIIAFDPTKNWRQERQKICSHWITGTLNGNAECSTCGSDTDYSK